MEGAGRQQTLLDDPGASGKGRGVVVVCEGFAATVELLGVVLGEEAVAGVVSRGGGDVEVALTVDSMHQGGLPLPVVFVILDDTERVDPEVPNAKSVRNDSSVSKGLGEKMPFYLKQMLANILFGGDDRSI